MSDNTQPRHESESLWETRHGTRVDVLAAIAYAFGPVSGSCCETARAARVTWTKALALLILETRNDYVRFHGRSFTSMRTSCKTELETCSTAYQSALLTTPLVALRIFTSLVQAPPWMQTFGTLLIVVPQAGMAYVFQCSFFVASTHKNEVSGPILTPRRMVFPIFIFPLLAPSPNVG